MTELIKLHDAWLRDGGPAALVLREALMPVEGKDGVLFPATYAPSEDKSFKGGYNIDRFKDDGSTVCLIDSVGAQANRIEPIFSRPPCSALVPQIVIRAGERQVNLLEAGHRAGDALVRCSALQGALQDAFKAVLRGNARPLAKIAPTSLVFGVWDSRDTQAKLPRLLAATIRAFNVRELTRSAQYNPAVGYVEEGLLPDPEGDKKKKDLYANRGFKHVPASGGPGGVIADGGVRRDVTLHLAALRTLRADDDAGSLALRRYILGLSLVAFAHPSDPYLRQGCNLVPDPEQPRQMTLVHGDGRREPVALTLGGALEYALAAAREFGVGSSQTVDFEKDRAQKDLGDEGEKKKKGAKG